MGMNLKQFKYVLVLANEGSFSKAADVLSIKQPSLSQYVKKIEQDVGAELFDRTGGNVRLTDAGRAYIEVGRKMLDLEHQLEEQLLDLAAYKTGTIVVGISGLRSASLMPEVVKAFQEKYPGILLKLDERNRGEILDAAEHGEFDLCLTTLPVDDKHFVYETVLVEENVVALPSSVKLPSCPMDGRKFPAVSVKALDGMSFNMLNEEHMMQQRLNDLCDKYAISLKASVICTSQNALLEMAKVGIGASFIPSCIAKKYEGITYYSLKEETSRREVILMHRRDRYLSQPVRDLAATIKEVLSDN